MAVLRVGVGGCAEMTVWTMGVARGERGGCMGVRSGSCCQDKGDGGCFGPEV